MSGQDVAIGFLCLWVIFLTIALVVSGQIHFSNKKNVGDLQVSPDGNYLVFTDVEPDGTKVIVAVSMKNPKDQFAFLEGTSPRWVGNTKIVFLRDNQVRIVDDIDPNISIESWGYSHSIYPSIN